ncbi:hypothetical protein OS493_027661 [Desmophyllum pertusum]|uniref:Uncharacterized protein n=1 Tax=Desmophyllum pertusum TaxID=174260 RepID=A0A9W9ZKR4_9CNID|nr:hypothetical protein OS493_027661 [Desmophyllum pertusum]
MKMIKCEPEDVSTMLSLSNIVSDIQSRRHKCPYCEKCYDSANDLHHHEFHSL